MDQITVSSQPEAKDGFTSLCDQIASSSLSVSVKKANIKKFAAMGFATAENQAYAVKVMATLVEKPKGYSHKRVLNDRGGYKLPQFVYADADGSTAGVRYLIADLAAAVEAGLLKPYSPYVPKG